MATVQSSVKHNRIPLNRLVWVHKELEASHVYMSHYNIPIMSLHVSELKLDQLPLVRAACSSLAVICPLRSASTARNQEYTLGSTPGGQPGGAPATHKMTAALTNEE